MNILNLLRCPSTVKSLTQNIEMRGGNTSTYVRGIAVFF